MGQGVAGAVKGIAGKVVSLTSFMSCCEVLTCPRGGTSQIQLLYLQHGSRQPIQECRLIICRYIA